MWTVSNKKNVHGRHLVHVPVCERSSLIVCMNVTDELDIFLVTYICTKRSVHMVVHILNGCMHVPMYVHTFLSGWRAIRY